MGFLLLTLLVSFCFLGRAVEQLHVQEGPSLVKALVGDDVLLKCTFAVDGETVNLSRIMVQWFHRGKLLAEFDNMRSVTQQSVSLSQEGLLTGNASLLISQVNPGNAGSYRCYVTYLPEMQIREVTLQVEEKTAATAHSQTLENGQEDSYSSFQPCLGYTDILRKLGLITKGLERMEAKLDVFMSGRVSERSSSAASAQRSSD